jgi:phosphonoacetate hydrolase
MRREHAVQQLASAETVGRVDGIAESLGSDRYRFTSAFGSVTWKRVADGPNWAIAIEETTGINLLDLQSTDGFVHLALEIAATNAVDPVHPLSHGRPYAYQSLTQLFDDPKVPRLLLVPAAGFPMHGNTGNHGALTSVQCRGMCIGAGPGVSMTGWVADHGRMIDVAPTLLALLGAPVVDGRSSTGFIRPGARLMAQDGDVLGVVANGSGVAKHVVAVVFDGCNTNLAADAMDQGEIPSLAGLLQRGTGLRHGIVSSFPTVTLPNHVTAFTGVHPGRHGIINNLFLDLDGEEVDLLSFSTMIHTQNWMSPDVETVHEAVHRWRHDAFTTCTYEYADRGADWSTFAEFRDKHRPFYATQADAQATATDWAYAESEQYRFMSRIDESSIGSAIQQWQGELVTGHPLPTLQSVNLGLTDDAGHQVGPHGAMARAALIDTDRRLGRLIDAISAAGALDDTAIVVISDHGMEQCDPELLTSHPMADLTALHQSLGLREVGDVFLHSV